MFRNITVSLRVKKLKAFELLRATWGCQSVTQKHFHSYVEKLVLRAVSSQSFLLQRSHARMHTFTANAPALAGGPHVTFYLRKK